MPDLMLRNIPEPLLKRLYSKAARDRWLVRPLLEQLIEDYVESRIRPSVDPPGNPLREQYRPVFGAVFDELIKASDWYDLSDRERGQRLRAAMLAEDEKYGRPPRFPQDFDFALVAKRLALPDVGKVAFPYRCPHGHATGLAFTPSEIEDGLGAGNLELWCQVCGRNYPANQAEQQTLLRLANRERERTQA